MLKKKSLKILSLCLILLIVLSAFAMTYASTDIEKPQLVNINLETGEITRENYSGNNQTRSAINRTEAFIPENVMPISTRAIVGGSDERTIIQNTSVFPYSSICNLEITYPNGKGYGTGFMIYKNLLLTAGHCAYDTKYGGQAVSIKVIPGKNGDSEPFGYTWVTNITCDARWFNSQNPDEDWSLLKLSSDIGNNTGWQGIAYSDDYSYFANGQSVRVTGYPKPQNRGFRQYTMRAPVIQANAMHLIYAVDTEGGQSGAPVIDDPGYAIGIHTNWTTVNGIVYNECSNITRARFNTFVGQMN